MIRTLAIAALFAFPSTSFAQQWLSDRRYSEGEGVSLGRTLVLHPGIGIEAGYDTNVFYASADDDAGVQSAGRLRVTPHLDLSTRPPQRLERADGVSELPNNSFRLGLAAAYQEYLSSDTTVTDQRNVGVDANLRGEFNRRGALGFNLSDTFSRTTDPANEGAFSSYNRIFNRADAALRYAPGGQTLEMQLGYGLQVNFFEEERWRPAGNYVSHDLYGVTRWKFFPKTAVIFDAHVTPTSYFDAAATHPSSIGVRVRTGLKGLLTSRLSALVLVGYGAGFYDRGDDFDSIIGQLELGYTIGPMSSVKLGYAREFFDSIFANFYVYDRGYLEFNQMIGGKVLLALSGSVGRLGYSSIEDPAASSSERVDVRAEAMLFGEYRARDWLGINLTANYIGNFTSFTYSSASGDDFGDFSKFQVFAGARAFY